MKNHNQVKVFVSVFLALLSVQGTTAVPCMAAPITATSEVSQDDTVETLTPSVVSVPEELPIEVAPSDFLSITSNHTIPNITKGTAVSISGIVKSDFSKITMLTVGVYNASGEQMTGKTVSPNQVEYDLHALDNEMQFSSLPTGTYYYRVTASNAAYQDYTVLNQSFSVSDSSSQLGASADDISITESVTIPNITAGQFVRLTGVITSAATQITKLTVGVFDQEGNQLTGKTVRPYSQSYDIRNLDSYVQFGTLSPGKYYYKVIATNTSNTNYIVVNQNFTVSESVQVTTEDSISILNGTTIPASIPVGKAISIGGTVQSDSNMTKITAGVYDQNNNLVTGRSAYPNAKSYRIENLDYYVSFGNLTAGTYYYKVLVSNGTHTNYTVVSQKFMVTNNGGSTASDAIRVVNGTTIPNTTVGKPVSIGGVVTSQSSNITKLTIGVFNENGTPITGRTVVPNSQTYNIANLDAYISFSSLSVGTYYYRVIATNGTYTNDTLVNQKFTVSNGSSAATDTMSITGGTTIPNIKTGNVVSIGGVVQSKSSNITKLTVGVYSASGNLITGRTIAPNAMSYNVANLDYYVSFGDLTAGTYYYKVIATNASYSNDTLVNQKFTVSDGSSAATDTMSITGGTTIPNIKTGNVVSIGGVVQSKSSNITKLTVGVYSASGNLITGRTIAPNAMSYNVANLDYYVSFGDLTAGTYYYKIIATNASYTNDTLVNQKFTVSDGSSTATDTMSITGGTTIPNIKTGNVVSIGGVVQSKSSNITKLTVGVYSASGNLITGRTIAPNATSYNVANLDYYVSFGDLTAGTYYYKVIATNASYSNDTLINQKFTVSDGSSVVTDTMSITGGTTIPNIKTGNVVSIGGVVQSKSSNITKLTVGVYSASGNLITGRTIAPNAASYNVANLDYYVSFGDLTAGTYYYKVIATNASYSNDTLVNQKFTVSDGSSVVTDKISITGGTSVSNIAEGSAVVVKGTVKSTGSNITKLTVGVYSSSGNLITGKTVTPNAKSYDLRNLDAYVNFNLLTAGNYTYRVIVSNGTQTNAVLTDQAFQVTAKGTSQNQTDMITLSGGKTIPNIKVGKAVSIRGTVKSASSNITSLTVGVFSSSGNLITGKTVSPRAKNYDISQLDAYVNFNLLSADTYYYGVVATNGSYQNKIVSYQKFTVSK